MDPIWNKDTENHLHSEYSYETNEVEDQNKSYNPTGIDNSTMHGNGTSMAERYKQNAYDQRNFFTPLRNQKKYETRGTNLTLNTATKNAYTSNKTNNSSFKTPFIDQTSYQHDENTFYISNIEKNDKTRNETTTGGAN